MTEDPTKVNRSERRRKQRGQSLVELALVLPLLLLLVAAVADFGRAFNSYIVITNAAREGARVGARVDHRVATAGIDDSIRAAVIREARNSGVELTNDQIDVEPERNEREMAQPITVTVNYSITTIFTGLVGLEHIPMRSRTAMVMYGISSD